MYEARVKSKADKEDLTAEHFFARSLKIPCYVTFEHFAVSLTQKPFLYQ